MLPEANLIFLDELLNANSAILNSLLMILNEKVFRRGRETRDLPVLMIVGASNHLPEDEALNALFDRFLLRVRCDYVPTDMLNNVLDAGWKMEKKQLAEDAATIRYEDVVHLQNLVQHVDIQLIRPQYIQLIQQMRNAGIPVSDRRAVKLQRLIAASALLSKRMVAMPSDIWILRYIWDTDEQEEVIAAIVKNVIEGDAKKPDAHPRAFAETVPNADAIFKEVTALDAAWTNAETLMSERSIIKDRLRQLTGRATWISNETQRAYIQTPIDALWQKILNHN
jgi:MoxR-like ATPase